MCALTVLAQSLDFRGFGMAEDTSAQVAIDRLDAALRRAEAAAARLASGGGSAALQARHRRLQEEVQAALGGLDRLITAAEAS
jgi:hypothetical protein